MNKILSDYTSEDFLNDHRFLNWVKYNDPDLGKFWEGWKLTNPPNKDQFEEAVIQLRLILSVKPISFDLKRLDTIFVEIENEINVKPLRSINFSFLRYAAAVLVPLTIVSLFYYSMRKSDHSETLPNRSQNHKQAKLTLSDGKVVLLNQNSQKILDAGGTLIQTDSIGLRYGGQTTQATLAYNTIDIPRGSEYKLIMTDGTELWLNSETRIRYPAKVIANLAREVYLEHGEVYFKVTKNKQSPFIVNLNGMQVEVLGTSFNVNTFDNAIITTLEEGKIRINRKGKPAVYQHPGDQTIYNPSSDQLTKEHVDTYPFTSWKKGWLVFNDNSLEEVMEQIGRWYNYKIQYESSSLKELRFGGKLKKTNDLRKILAIVERSNEIRATLIQDFIYIQKKP